jgi:dTDP-3-amino-2,3,6-trideoxy-4-keto-D-glucose/dTDP-3-amino-3,4,6-trideoxy-alpha-D-glucose/dTDP-2,6-dideoxy-D-kanosamine transaminase
MTIKVWDYQLEYARDRDEILATVDRVFKSGRLILGDAVKAFEQDFASYCGSKYGIGVDNATNAAFLCYKTLGIQPGDEIITVPLTAVPTISAIVAAGAVPVFVDVDPKTLLMDVTKLEKAITPRTRAIVPVHLYGQCVDMDPLLAIADRHEVPVIEDCAQCHGATYNGRKAGSMGRMATFSFYPTKPLGTFGDGGLILTSDDATEAKLRRLRYYGMDKTYYAEVDGYNSRLDEVHAAILSLKMRRLDADNARRHELGVQYDRALLGLNLQIVPEQSGNRHVYHLYVARHKRRDELVKLMGDMGVGLGIHYPWPVHTMRAFARFGYKEGDFPVAERATREVFSLPMFSTLSDDDQKTVCDALHTVCAILGNHS